MGRRYVLLLGQLPVAGTNIMP